VDIIQAVRGINDVLPSNTPTWSFVESQLINVIKNYGYDEIRLPIFEKTELFKRSIGLATDIVSKEMYTFEDRNGDLLSLRPEGTAGCVRAGIQHGILYNQQQRLWYKGSMFRRERPQKGRYRQFNQIGVEAFGIEGPDVDAELIFMSSRFWEALGLKDKIRLEINSLGSSDARKKYREVLVDYFKDNIDQFDDETKTRLELNPLRILDSKEAGLQELITSAPKIIDYLDDDSKAHFDKLLLLLDAAGLKYEVNPKLVRGLDYYTKTVFEWITDELGSQNAVCAGGRFDGLVEQLGGKPTPATGFALGLERLVELYVMHSAETEAKQVDAFMIMVGDEAQASGLILAENLRNQHPSLSLMLNQGGGSFKN